MVVRRLGLKSPYPVKRRTEMKNTHLLWLQLSRYGERNALVNEIPDLLDKHHGDFIPIGNIHLEW